MDSEEFKFTASPFPTDFIPREGDVFVAVDRAIPGSECTVKGFYDRATGVIHIQDVIFTPPCAQEKST